MYDKIFGGEAYLFMIQVSDGTEDVVTVERFRTLLMEKVSYPTLMMIAKVWNTMRETGQVSIACKYVGMNDASRFMMYLDYLSMKVESGEFT